MLVAVCSVGGAPGVTTVAASLAAVWPASPVCVPVLVEADASGGDMAAWRGLAAEGPGLVSLAAASRRCTLAPVAEPGEDEDAEERWHNPLLVHAGEVAGGLRVVLAPTAPPEAQRAVAMVADNTGLLARAPVVVADVGRAVPGSAGARLLAQAHAVVVVAGGDAAQLGRIGACASLWEALSGRGGRVGLALSGGCAFADVEVAEACGLGVWARIPDDSVGAGLVRGEDVRLRGMRARVRAWRHRRRDPDSLEWVPLLAAARDLADFLDDLRGIGAVAEPAEAAEVGRAA